MRYYNSVCDDYLRLLKSLSYQHVAEIEILDATEKSCGIVTGIISGTINHGYSQGMCRTCSITVSGEYLCNPDSPFWINRKFKVLIGISDGNDCFMFPHGVFTVKEITESLNGNTTIEGVDKFAYFNGDIGAGVLQGTYCVGAGTKACEVIKDILMQPSGTGQVIDCIPPDIDVGLYKLELPYDISVSNGESFGKLLTEIATAMRADIFYGPDGALSVCRSTDSKEFLPSVYDFDGSNICSLSTKYDLSDIVNQCTVIGKETSGLICQYTAENRNPVSPLCIQAIGLRAAEPIESDCCYDTDRCRDYAEYTLSKKSIVSASGSLTCRLIPHINAAGNAVTVMRDKCIISEISVSIDSGTMTLSICNKDNL